MGAETFTNVAKGKDVESAFWRCVEQACYDHGNSGYSGTIAEKHEYVSMQDLLPDDILPAVADCTDDEMTWRRIHAIEHYIRKYDLCSHERCDNKWGPAGYVEAAPGWFIFFGWASS